MKVIAKILFEIRFLGFRDGMVKYDGAFVCNWRVIGEVPFKELTVNKITKIDGVRSA